MNEIAGGLHSTLQDLESRVKIFTRNSLKTVGRKLDRMMEVKHLRHAKDCGIIILLQMETSGRNKPIMNFLKLPEWRFFPLGESFLFKNLNK